MMKFRFQSFIDVSTSATSMQVLQWSVGGNEVIDRCKHLFGAYKYFKLGKISVKMVPASTLPVDPLGLSYATDDPQTVDPRDQMNPGLVRITNGEDIFTNISVMSASDQQKVYNAMMLDPRWSKFMLQSGFRRSAYPLYWQVGQLSQDKWPGATENIPWFNSGETSFNINSDGAGTIAVHNMCKQGSSPMTPLAGGSSARGLFQVGHRGKLGFLPTDYFQEVFKSNGTSRLTSAGVNNVPEVSVITCVLPKAYKTIYYYRIFITEEVIFSGLRSSPPVENGTLMGLDQFLYGQPVIVGPPGFTGLLTNNPRNNGDELP